MKAIRLEFFEAPWGEVAQRGIDAIDAGRRAHGLTPRSSDLWSWRGAQPGGALLGVAWNGDRVAAAMVALRREVLLEGAPSSWLEVVDVFNDFEAGAGLVRSTAYLELGRAFAKELGGRAPEMCPVMYGFPNRRAHRIGLARLGYEVLRSENVLVADPDTYVSKPDSGVDVAEVAEFPADVGALFERVASGRGAIGVRTQAWLDWRFVRHPSLDYRIAVARREGKLCGYLVQRRGNYAGHEGGVLADWMVPTDDPGAAWELLTWAGQVVREEGGRSLVINVPDRQRASAPGRTCGGGTSSRSSFWPQSLSTRAIRRVANVKALNTMTLSSAPFGPWR